MQHATYCRNDVGGLVIEGDNNGEANGWNGHALGDERCEYGMSAIHHDLRLRIVITMRREVGKTTDVICQFQ